MEQVHHLGTAGSRSEARGEGHTVVTEFPLHVGSSSVGTYNPNSNEVGTLC